MVAKSGPSTKSNGAKATGPRVLKQVRKKTISFGSDFAGIGTVGIALKKLFSDPTLNLVLDHLFSCDKARFAKQIIEYNHPPKHWDNDVLTRDLTWLMPKTLGLYSFTAPCQGLSSAGLQLGAADPRTRLALNGVAVVIEKLPKAFMMENVVPLVTHTKKMIKQI